MPTISIDCRMVNSSGIGTYIKNIVPLVISKLTNVNFFLLGNNAELSSAGLLDNSNVDCIEFNAPIYSIREQVLFPRLIHKETILFWSPHYNIPIRYSGGLLVTIMDLGHLALKQDNNDVLKKTYAKFMFNQVKNKADATIYISEFSKSEFNKYIGKPYTDQFITLLGIHDDWYNIPIGDNLNKGPFLLYVGNVKPHKNLGALVDAFGKICDKIPHNLVIVGKKEGFITGDNTVVEKAKEFMNRIIFTGRVTDDKLKQYIKQADIFVFPSLYEGFGFPPLEAMAAGTPVLSSNAASIPEICGDAVLYFNPHDIDQIANRILKMINKYSLKKEYIIRGKKRAKKYNWGKTSIQTINIIQELIKKEIK
jgi:glycosyltransferase involved in cell wall biosynthesis